MRRILIGSGILIGLLILVAASGWTAVEPGEVVVVRRLGRVVAEPWGPGPHWAWPFGLDRLTRLRVDEVRRLDFGLARTPGPLDAPGLGEYLTGDGNLLKVQGVVQYRVLDPSAFVLRAADRDGLLGRMTEASLARALASRGVDGPMMGERPVVARSIQDHLAASVGSLGLGVEILGVSLTDARPPIEVEPSFAEAQGARSDRDRRVSEGQAVAATLRPAALAAAQGSTDLATARADRARAMARGRADRFLALLAEADRSRPLTVRRLYRDALRDLLPRVRRKVLLTPDEPIDLGLFGSPPR